MRDLINKKKGYRFHYIKYSKQFAVNEMDVKTVQNIAFSYGEDEMKDEIAGMIGSTSNRGDVAMYARSFTVADSLENIVLTSGSGDVPVSNSPTRAFVDVSGSLEEDFSSLVEPLFSLPTKLPVSAWQGHIPLLFVLLKLLKPRTYVELGVYTGASLIAACTAAKSYGLDTTLYGIDSWQGDEHAGIYEGDQIYTELKNHLDANFNNVKLLRCFFAEARQHFREESIDLLHIDGLHTYEAVKEDFNTWIGAMAPSGVILFHDICVYERGFGVHRFWAELKEIFSTVEFHHSHGLGVLFLNPTDNRLAALTALASNKKSLEFYRNLVSLIGDVLPDRMGYFSTKNLLEERDREISLLKSELQALLYSKSWRITEPLRALKRLLNRF